MPSSRATRTWPASASAACGSSRSASPSTGYGMVLTQAFNGAGDTRTPTLINLFCLWLWEIPLAWFLAGRAGFGPTGVFIAVSVAFVTLAIVSSWLFSKGHWKTQRV